MAAVQWWAAVKLTRTIAMAVSSYQDFQGSWLHDDLPIWTAMGLGTPSLPESWTSWLPGLPNSHSLGSQGQYSQAAWGAISSQAP